MGESLAPQLLPYAPAAELQEVLDDLNRLGNPLDSMTAATVPGLWLMRETWSRNILRPIPMDHVHDVAVPARNRQIPVRIYVPPDKALAARGKLPVTVYLHGGGWALGSIATYDSISRGLADKAGTIVVSVDYRLAPEHPFPAALEDAHLALEWASRNAGEFGGDAQRLAVAGDSAGATLATVVALRARKEGIPVPLQALFYPSTNISSGDYPSHEQYGQKHWLTRRAAESFRSFYLPHREDWFDPQASPLLATDADLKRMPAAFIMTCGCDPLRDEGEAYANRLRENGVAVTYRLEEQMIHACLSLFNSKLYPRASQRVERVLAEAAAAVRSAFENGRTYNLPHG